MYLPNIKQALSVAEEFIILAERVEKETRGGQSPDSCTYAAPVGASKWTGALRRKSMDLSRCLANMRKS